MRPSRRMSFRRWVSSSSAEASSARLISGPTSDGTSDIVEILRDCDSSAHFPKFVLHRSDHFHELRKVMGTGKLMILVPLFYLTFLGRICRKWCRNVK